jgi:hypothetical protein
MSASTLPVQHKIMNPRSESLLFLTEKAVSNMQLFVCHHLDIISCIFGKNVLLSVISRIYAVTARGNVSHWRQSG